MKNLRKTNLLPWLTLGLGAAAALGALALVTWGVDGGGLLLTWHWSGVFLWATCLLMAGVLLVYVQRMGGKCRYSRMFPPSRWAAVGIAAFGLGILAASFDSLAALAEPVRLLSGLLKLICAAALGYLAWCRWEKRRESFLGWAAVAVYLMIRLMFEYRDWSSEPQLLRYFFHLGSSVCLSLAAYQRTAFCVDLGSRRRYLFFTQMGAFFAMPALVIDFQPFYLGAVLWAVTDLCTLRPMKAHAPEETA